MNFVRRNSPILFIGFIVAIVFVVITIIGQSQDPETTLVDAITSTFSVSQRETSTPTAPEYTAPSETEVQLIPPEEEETPPEVVYPVLEIFFGETGFSPRSVNARTGQTVRWFNTTENDITIKELIPKYPEFSTGVTIPPDDSYELLLYKPKTWTFEEQTSGYVGKLIILTGTL